MVPSHHVLFTRGYLQLMISFNVQRSDDIAGTIYCIMEQYVYKAAINMNNYQ